MGRTRKGGGGWNEKKRGGWKQSTSKMGETGAVCGGEWPVKYQGRGPDVSITIKAPPSFFQICCKIFSTEFPV